MKILFFLLTFTFLQAEAKDLKIAFIGDSLTEGLGIEKEKAFPSLLEQKILKKGKKVTVLNAGIGGATSASAAARVRWVLKAKPDWVVLALGANDALRGLDTGELKKNLIAAIKLAEKENIQIMLIGMKAPPNMGNTYSKNFEGVFKDIAKSNKGILFLPFLLEKVAGEKAFNQADGIHPNEKGHEIIAEHIWKVLEPKI